MIDVQAETVIRRPRSDVAAFLFDPRHERAWSSGVLATRALDGALLHEGARVERVVRLLGRRYRSGYEVVASEDQRSVELAVAGPFPHHVRYELEDAPEGTRVRLRVFGLSGGVFGLTDPALAVLVRRTLVRDLETLRLYLAPPGRRRAAARP